MGGLISNTRFSFLLASATSLLILTGCPRPQNPAYQDAITIVSEGRPITLDPRLAVDAYSTRILALVLRGLTRIDQHGQVQPDLVARWEYASPITLQLYLKSDQRFDDGLVIDSTVVAKVLKSYSNPQGHFARAAGLDRIRQIATPSSNSVVLTLSEPFAPLLSTLSLPMVHPNELFATNLTLPTGNGWYRFASVQSLDNIILERVHNQTMLPERLRFTTASDANARVFALETGAADLAQNAVPVHDLPSLASVGLRVQTYPGWNVSYLGLNTALPKLSDARVRQALGLAIDRRSIVKNLLLGTASLCESILPPANAFYAASAETPYNPQQARALLAAAGYGPSQRLQLEYKTSSNPERIRIAEAIAADLTKVDVVVNVRPLEFATFFADIASGNFEVFSLTWVGVHDPDHLHYALHSQSLPPHGGNRGHFADAQLDQLLSDARRELDEHKRRQLYTQAQARIRQLRPVIPLWTHSTIIVSKPTLPEFIPLPDGAFTALLPKVVFE